MTREQYIEETTNRNMEIATTILNQLGGKRFVVMTGAKDFMAIKDGLKFKIGRNASKANTVEIKLNGLDLYDIRFSKYIPCKLVVNHKKGTAEWKETKDETVKTFKDCYCDMLQELFTEVTGLYTHF